LLLLLRFGFLGGWARFALCHPCVSGNEKRRRKARTMLIKTSRATSSTSRTARATMIIFSFLFLATTVLATDFHQHLRSPPKQWAVLGKDDSHQAAIPIDSSLRKAVTGLKPYNTLQQQREPKQCEPGWYGVNCSQFIGGDYDYTLQVTLPLPDSTVTEEEVAIQGTISPADEGVFTILCEVFSSSTVYVTLSEISSSGEFTVYVTLSEGINILKITAFSPTAEVLASTHIVSDLSASLRKLGRHRMD